MFLLRASIGAYLGAINAILATLFCYSNFSSSFSFHIITSISYIMLGTATLFQTRSASYMYLSHPCCASQSSLFILCLHTSISTHPHHQILVLSVCCTSFSSSLHTDSRSSFDLFTIITLLLAQTKDTWPKLTPKSLPHSIQQTLKLQWHLHT